MSNRTSRIKQFIHDKIYLAFFFQSYIMTHHNSGKYNTRMMGIDVNVENFRKGIS